MTSSFSNDQLHLFADHKIASSPTEVKKENLALTSATRKFGSSGFRWASFRLLFLAV
jgi:hypothetical protein